MELETDKVYSCYKSPIGKLLLEADSHFLTQLSFVDNEQEIVHIEFGSNAVIAETRQQLTAYFNGKLKKFTIELSQKCTPFQHRCWKYLQSIPYGETRAYFDEATGVGNNKAVRAVANTNRQNAIAIIIPCHRVIGKNGSLTGYGGGIWRKKWLLEHEQSFMK